MENWVSKRTRVSDFKGNGNNCDPRSCNNGFKICQTDITNNSITEKSFAIAFIIIKSQLLKNDLLTVHAQMSISPQFLDM